MNTNLLERIQGRTVDALWQAHAMINAAGAIGPDFHYEVARADRSGTTLLGDYLGDVAVVAAVKDYGIPTRVLSEEQGEGKVIGGEKAEFSILIDGLDGTDRYKAILAGNIPIETDSRHSTMVALFEGDNPNYEDYLFSGVIEHGTGPWIKNPLGIKERAGRLFYATKGQGAFMVDGPGAVRKQMKTSDQKEFTIESPFCGDWEFDPWAEKNSKIDPNKTLDHLFRRPLQSYNIMEDEAASSAFYLDVADGSAHIAVELTRGGVPMKFGGYKKNLEPGICYAFVKEAGGTMVDMDGDEFANKSYLEYGQYNGQHTPIVTTANEYMAESFFKVLESKK